MSNAKDVLKKINESIIDESDIDMSKPWAVVYSGNWNKKSDDSTLTINGRVLLLKRETFATESQAKRRAKENNADYGQRGSHQKVRYGNDYQVVDLRKFPKSDIYIHKY